MNGQATDFLVASRAAVVQAGQLLVQYSFSVLGALVLLVAGWLIASMLHRWVLAGMTRIRHFDVTLARFLANVLRYIVLLLVLVTVLGQFGVQTASIIATLGAAGLAVGLALQGTLQNIAAGIMLLILRPFRVGEAIETKDVSGTVQEIGLFATELRTGDGLYLLAPNSTLWNTPVKNYSRFNSRRFDVVVILPADSDLRSAEQILQNIARRDKRVRSSPAPMVGISDITNDTAKLTLEVWLSTADYGAASRDLQKAAKMAFDKIRADSAPENSVDPMSATPEPATVRSH